MPTRATSPTRGGRRKSAGSRSKPRSARLERTKRFVIQLKRAYEPSSSRDGARVLVDRVWPRGMTRQKMKIDAWLRDLGPSTALRKWFGHDPANWEEFRARYRKELNAKRPLFDDLAAHARDGKLTLVFGARDLVHNQAVVIKEVLEGKRRAR
ncbi:MAG TPA: DUF488 family protein [bacterium]|nr:DUF488 family protein [bacterium]